MHNPYKVSKSFEQFSIKFKALLEQATKSDTTIFSNFIEPKKIELLEDSLIMEHYGYFLRNHNYIYHQAPSDQQGKIIINSIQESFFQHTFNQYLDNIILESKDKGISLTSQILLENTVERFNIDLQKVGVNYLETKAPLDTIEENVFGFGAGTVAAVTGVSALPAVGISMLTSFALALLVPANNMNSINNWIGNWTGKIGRAFTGSYNLWQLGLTPSLGQSYQNILNFDNIDADPAVKELFKKIQKVHINDEIAQKGLTSLVAECVHQNSNILKMVDSEDTNILSGLFTPNKYNILKLMIKSIISKSEVDKNEYDTLLRFRKCLSNKLVDVYKLLLVSNLQGKKDYNRILNTVTKANSDRPEQLLNFLPNETDEDRQLKEAILALIMFRLHLSNLVKQLDKGFFDVDKESAKFLEQKLKTVDSEVENYLRLNKSKNYQPFEGKPMDRKPSLTKRSLLSQLSLTN